MFDTCSIFNNLQKLFQKSNLILPDVLAAKDSAVEHLKIMKDLSIPGGKGEQNLENRHEDDCDTSVRKAKTTHQFLSSGSRDSHAIRNEIVESAINFLDQRMNTENDGTMQNLIQILDAKSSKEFILASRELATQILEPSIASLILLLIFVVRGPTSARFGMSMSKWKTTALYMLHVLES